MSLSDAVSRFSPPRPRPLILALALALAAPLAQADETAADAGVTLDAVQVTGTNLRRSDEAGVNPVLVLDRATIERSGKVTVSDLLRSLTANSGNSFNEQYTGSFANGSAGVSLRGLSQKNTLVLVNGYRVAAYGFAQNTQDNFVDLNALPLGAVERIEVLKDGASALYGSDAIAGVVNIILRRKIEGVELDAAYGAATEGGIDQRSIGVRAGLGDPDKDGYSLRFSLDVLDRGRLDADERDLTRDGDYRDQPGGRLAGWSTQGGAYLSNPRAPQRFAHCQPGTQARPYADFGSPLPGEACAFNTQPYRTLLPDVERYQASLAGDYWFNDSVQGFAELLYSTSHNGTYFGAPLSVGAGLRAYDRNTGRLVDIPVVLPVGHPNNPFGVPTPFETTFLDLGARYKINKSQFQRTLVGLRGRGEVWDWELAANYSESRQREYVRNFVDRYAFERVLADGSYDFLNPASTPLALESLRLSTRRPGTYRLATVNAKVSGFPWQWRAGDVGVAGGVEFRDEAQDARTSPQVLSGTELRPAINLIDGQRRVSAAFVEFSLKPFENVEVQLAGRGDHYSDFGSAFSPKLGVRWQPSEDWLLRLNASRGFRAPSLPEIAQSTTISYGSVIDPYDPVQPGGSRGVTILRAGNPDLDAERSSNVNLGALWSPSADTSLGVDLYRIRQRDLIGPDSLQAIVSNPAAYPGRVTRDAQGRLQLIENRYANQGTLTTTGFDIEGRQVWHAGDVDWTLDGSWTRLLSYEQPQVAGERALEGAGGNRFGALPKWRGITSLGVGRGDWNAQLSWRYIGGYAQQVVDARSNPGLRGKVEDSHTFDLYLAYQGVRDSTVYLSVQNLTDRDPPFDPAGGALPYDITQYDGLGRFVTVGFKHRF
ncbi:TonB-dependent receptor [Lysobacter sp. 5GHs7-4]|uniref:TonB-dependent receptor n=1 Tax=Lysobacter sp. 5GHs7-4 TaxID=2904253 RepID=UPI001E3B00FC|nr:TonB-dependent receptor [Lysobacter sp. 5GHs7-4]UHQ24510.1 TonB-dependent receptor [Lysobacter sp. 5GHs7-4]